MYILRYTVCFSGKLNLNFLPFLLCTSLVIFNSFYKKNVQGKIKLRLHFGKKIPDQTTGSDVRTTCYRRTASIVFSSNLVYYGATCSSPHVLLLFTPRDIVTVEVFRMLKCSE